MDLIEALEAAEIEYRHGRDEDEIWLCCPFCEDQRFRFGVNVVSGKAHCFNDGCEWSGRGQYTFDRLKEKLDTGEIEGKQRRRKKKRRMENITLPDGFRYLKPPDEDNYHWNKIAWGYIRKRGITRQQIRDKKIGFTTTDNYLSYRIIFPVYVNGKLVGLSGRDFTGKQDPPHKNSVGDKCLFNLPERKHSTCVLSEATISALAIEQAAEKMSMDSLGLLGHSLHDSQLDLLKHYKRVVLWLDPDVAGVDGLIGKNGSSGIYQKLRDAGKSVYVVLPKGMLENKSYDERDPDELELHERKVRLENAIKMTDTVAEKLAVWRSFDE